MLKQDVLAHFETPAAVAKALHISVQAVSQWGPVIPEVSAYKVESVTRGKLRVDPAVYDRLKAAGKGRAAMRQSAA